MSDDAVFDGWARAYDVIHESKKENVRDGRDVAFYARKASEATGKTLEIGCGTGRVYLPLLRDGNDVHGIDTSVDQLRILRSKAEEEGLDPEVSRADMRSFDRPERYGLILVPYNTFRHNLTPEDQLRTLTTIERHLTDGGTAIIEFRTPDLRHSTDEQVVTSEFTHDGDEFFLVKSFRIEDDIEQLLRFRQRLYRNGTLVSENDYRYARIYKREFRHLLHRAGFDDWELHVGFEDQPEESDGKPQNLIWELKK